MKVIYIADAGGHFASEVEVYEKRLKSSVEFIRIRPVKHTEREYVIRQESLKVAEILAKLRERAIVLDEYGKEWTTTALATKLRKGIDSGKSPVFVIGGSFGLDRDILREHTEETMALSQLTFPHSLALLVLAEQLYRVHEIWKGSKYHHE